MNDKFEKLIQAGKRVGLDQSEKLILDEKIRAHIQANPATSAPVSAVTSYALPLIVAGLIVFGGIILLRSSFQEQVSELKTIPTSTDSVSSKRPKQKQFPNQETESTSTNTASTTTASSSDTFPINQWPGQGRDATNN